MKTNEMNNNKALNDDLLDEVTGGVIGGVGVVGDATGVDIVLVCFVGFI